MRIPISKSGSVRGLELLSRNLGRGSIDRGTKGSLNGGQPFRNDRCRRADRNFADSGSPRPCVATARRVTKWTGSTTFSDYLRVTLSLKLANLQFTAPVERLKRRGGERGEMFPISVISIALFEIGVESLTKKLGVVRTID